MATVILVRHGRTTANAAGLLAGRTAGVKLDETGIAQAGRTAARLADVRIAGLVTSPQERCRQTARIIATTLSDETGEVRKATTERGLAECDYGDWQGGRLKDLAKEKLWQVVQRQPSAVTFPGGESMVAMQHRAVSAVRRLDRAFEDDSGPDAVWVAVSHGDLIKAILADALGMHLDLFQRIHVDPASISIVRYTDERPYVLGTNTHSGDLGWLSPPKRPRSRRTDAVVGGGAGPDAPPADHTLG